ncbi:MAG: sugar ABC transporter ATP-binding protein [Spirochaetaceae bacterium]|jgi:methyl-galactoside transport system ATP-binding protein|nr:sugar ABC transporter ATP-binding protein [Spirochaetaceae bacterium]
MGQSDFVLEMDGISKSFPGVKALDNVTLHVRKGEVHALMGENGAGKSTLMKCLFGIYDPDGGTIRVDGETVKFSDAKDALSRGISMIHQELSPVKDRSVMENLWLGRFPERRVLGIPFVDHRAMYEKTLEVFASLQIDIDPKVWVRYLSVSKVQMLEIAKACSMNAKIIIMDEPSSSLTENEVDHLFKIINTLRDKGVSIIYISHKIEEILRISDEVTIMRDGKSIGTWPAEGLTNDFIIAKMVGRDLSNRFPPRSNIPGDDMLTVSAFTSAERNSFQDVSFTLRRGEILGIGGLVGAKRSELVETMFGLRPLKSGEMSMKGKKLRVRSSIDAKGNGMALLTEERRATGIIPMLSVLDNTVIANLIKYLSKIGLIRAKQCAGDVDDSIEKLRIKTPSRMTRIKDLSGGNQQKTLFARWLLTNPEILILDEPTRGIDVGAKYEIYTIIANLAQEGKSIIMISSEMPELLGMSDRIMVMCAGRMTGILDGKTATQEEIMRLATQFAKESTKGANQ